MKNINGILLVSLISRLLIIFLIYKEVTYYQEAKVKYQFIVDTELDTQVPMHVDITVAMPCKSLSGLDLMDETRQDVFAYGTLQREDVFWELTPAERRHFQRFQHMNSFLREEYHSVQDILWKDILHSEKIHDTEKQRTFKTEENAEYDACRLRGTLAVNKVENFFYLSALSC